MKHPQIAVFESDNLLARYLDQLVERRRWLLRESRQIPACVNLLLAGGPSVLVIKIGRNLIREYSLLAEVHELLPNVPILVVSDAEDTALEALAYDLGADFVLQPPEPRTRLIELVERVMESTIARNGLPESVVSQTTAPAVSMPRIDQGETDA
jgi:DNA-binding NtrC family response regulator